MRVSCLSCLCYSSLSGGSETLTCFLLLGEKSPETAALRNQVKTACEELIIDFFDRGGQASCRSRLSLLARFCCQDPFSALCRTLIVRRRDDGRTPLSMSKPFR